MSIKLEIWRRGITLSTEQTKKWTREQVERNDVAEAQNVFSDFKNTDQGKSRQLVCSVNPGHFDYERNVKLIAAAPSLLSACIMAKEELQFGGDWETAKRVIDSAIKSAMG